MMRCTCSMFWTEGSSQFFCFHLSRCPHHPVMWWVIFFDVYRREACYLLLLLLLLFLGIAGPDWLSREGYYGKVFTITDLNYSGIRVMEEKLINVDSTLPHPALHVLYLHLLQNFLHCDHALTLKTIQMYF
ncbi:unnamed protein product, partial [Prunus brigantina]